VFNIRRVLLLIACLAFLSAVGISADGPSAGDLLANGQRQFQNQDYVASRTTLWQAYGLRDNLSQQQRQVLADLLGKVDRAIEAQVVGQARYAAATRSLQARKWQDARPGLAATADSPYLAPKLRAQAKDQLAMVEMKIAAQANGTAAEQDAPTDQAQLASADKPERSDELIFDPDEAEAQAQPKKPEAKKLRTAPAQEVKQTPAAEKKPAPAVEKTPSPEKIEKTPTKVTAVPSKPAGPTAEQAKKIKVDMLLAQGNEALNKNQAAKAVDIFSRALQLDPQNELARAGLGRARQLTARPASAGILTRYQRQLRVEKQIAQQDIQLEMKRSMELMAKPANRDTFDAAEQAARRAKGILQNNKRLFTTGEYRSQLAKTEDQLKWIRTKRAEFSRGRLREQIAKIDTENRQRTAKVRMMRDQRIAELTTRAQSLFNDNEFYQAMHVMKEIIELDSNNGWALNNIAVVEKCIILQQQKGAARRSDLEASKLSADVRHSEIPWYDLIRYPKDWKELTARRERFGASQINESEEDRKLNKRLDGKIQKVDFREVAFSDFVDFLRDNSGANIFVNWKALEAAGIDKTQTITIKLSNVTFRKALELSLNDIGGGATELGYAVNDGVISISTREDLNRETETLVYDIRDLLIRIPNFTGNRVNLSSIGESLSTGGSSGGGGSGGSLFDDDTGTDDEETEDVAQTRSQMINNVRRMITETIAPASWRPEGEIGAINELNGNLVITQTSENHRQIHKLVSSLRESRTIQVAIEARFITVNTGFLSQIGVDLDFYFNLGSQIHGGAPTVTDPITGVAVPAAGNSTWQNQGYQPGRMFNSVSPIGVGQNSTTFSNILTQTTNVAGGIGRTMELAGGNPAMSIVGTFLDDIQVDFLIEATQAHQSTRTLTAPRLTLFNGQRAYVSVQTSQAYISGVEQVVSENATAPQPEISYAPTGTLLDVDATVSHDRRYVTLTLRPQVVTLNLNDNGEISGTNVSGVFIGLPIITLQDIQTTVSVPDGGTLLIGGQKLTGEVEREMGVPVLSKLPIINRAFTNKGKLRDEETLLILIKPQIIIQDEAEQDPSRRLEEPAFETGLGVD